MANLKINKNNLYIELTISISGKEWKEFISKSEKNLISNLEIKGFRKGNVPEAIAKKNIKNDKIFDKAINLAIDENYSKAIEMMIEEKIATKPKLIINKITMDEVEIVLKAPKIPEVKLGDRSGISIKLELPKVTEEELEPELNQLKSLFEEPIIVNEKIIKNDVANIDFEGKLNGESFEGGTSKGFDLKIGSKSFIDNFEDQLIGMLPKEEKNIKVTFPETYPEEKLKGKEVNFDVKVNSVKRMKKLEGEDLTNKLKQLNFNSIEEIELKVRKYAQEQKDKESKDKFFKDYVSAIIELKDTNLIFPEEIIISELENDYKNFEKQLEKQNVKINDYFKMNNTNLETFKEKIIKPQTKRKLKDSLIYSALIKELNIKVSDDDCEKEYKKIAEDSKMDLEVIKKQFSKENIETSLIYSKLIDVISK